MKAQFEELNSLLGREKELYRELVQLAKTKQEQLVQNDLEGIGTAVADEEKILEKISGEEEKRKDLLGQIEGEDKSFADLCQEAPEDLTNSLRETREGLLLVLEELWEVNETNNRLIQDSLEFNNNLVNSLAKIRGSSTYSKEGNREETRSFLDKRA